MILADFARTHRVRAPRRTSDGSLALLGRRGQIYVYDATHFALMLTHEGALTRSSRMKWTHARKRALAAGFTLLQDGDDEGTFLFDPTDAPKSRLALALAAVKRRRRISPAQAEALARAREMRANRRV